MSPQKMARQKFGFDHLHAGQKEAICAVLEGRDTLAILPTGGGKSAIYQIAGLSLEGPTIVVSPLLALQRDTKRSPWLCCCKTSCCAWPGEEKGSEKGERDGKRAAVPAENVLEPTRFAHRPEATPGARIPRPHPGYKAT